MLCVEEKGTAHQHAVHYGGGGCFAASGPGQIKFVKRLCRKTSDHLSVN